MHDSVQIHRVYGGDDEEVISRVGDRGMGVCVLIPEKAAAHCYVLAQLFTQQYIAHEPIARPSGQLDRPRQVRRERLGDDGGRAAFVMVVLEHQLEHPRHDVLGGQCPEASALARFHSVGVLEGHGANRLIPAAS